MISVCHWRWNWNSSGTEFMDKEDCVKGLCKKERERESDSGGGMESVFCIICSVVSLLLAINFDNACSTMSLYIFINSI